MWAHIIRRLIATIPVLLLVSLIVFSLMHLAEGDPVDMILGEERADEEVIAALRAKLGLDRPLHEQYLRWLGNVVRGDLGYSFRSRIEVRSAIVQRLAVTVELTILAMLIALAISLPLGVLAAIRRNQTVDFVASAFAALGASMPNFWLGILLVLVFSLKLGWLPPIGYVPLSESPWMNLKLMILPSITLGTAYAAVVTRMTRSSMLEVLNEDYIRTARAKGLSERMLIYVHAMKNALLPIVTVIGMEVGRLLGGAVVTESIFALPGMGRLAVDSVLTHDFPIVQGVTLFMALALLLSNLVADIVYVYVDPRIRYD